MPTWPSTLPQSPLLSGYRRSGAKNVIVTQMDVGPPKRRLRTTGNPGTADLSFECTVSQRAIFEDFYANTIVYGALTWTMPNPENALATVTYGLDLAKGVPSYVPAQDDPTAVTISFPVLVYP